MSNTKLVQRKKTALDVVEEIRERLLDTAASLEPIIELRYLIDDYDAAVKEDAIQLEQLNTEKASDKELNAIAVKHGLTMNQAVGLMDMCEQLNNSMVGSGIVSVPFWFHEQYMELKEKNEALITQTDSLMVTLAKVEEKVASGKSTVEDIGLELPQRKNIITGSTTPYIAGVTGARLGDEHLDPEHVYIPQNIRSK